MASDIAIWLERLGLGQYAQAFEANSVDLDLLADLTEDDLKQLGLNIGERRRLRRAISQSARQAVGPTPTDAADSGERTQAERRQLTVMFCDLVGSTELSRRLDPEDMREVIRTYQITVAGEIVRYGGHVAKFMGDGVLVFFGFPRAHEGEGERAARAGLGVAAAVAALKVGSVDGLAVRIGIATGQVVVGDLVGQGAAQEEAVIGEAPNMAARLQEIAGPGEVVVAETTRHLLGDLFELRDLGRLALKGYDAPARAWRVLAERAADSRFEAVRGHKLARFVGREHELGLLTERWQLANEGEGQVVLLSGEAGIGKSRVVQELDERLTHETRLRLRFQCSPYHTGSALHPVVAQLERAADIAPRDVPARKLDKLEALVAQTGYLHGDVVPLLADLLAISLEDRYAPLALTPEQRKKRTMHALLEWLRGHAKQGPVLWLLEDAHWIDPTTLDLMALIVDAVQTLPVLVIVTYRPDFAPPWHGYTHVSALALNRLSRSQSSRIVHSLCGGRVLPPAVLERIIEKTDGMPLFVEELTQDILESGHLREQDGRYELTSPLRSLAVPTSLQDLLMARLDRLESGKEVAQIGAAIGREFSFELVAAVAPLDGAALSRALAQLTDSELLFCRGTPPQATYAFKHALVQEVAYGSLLRRRRENMHDRIARALEALFPEINRSQPEILAHHFTEAGCPREAIRYWKEAGERAASASSNIEAIRHLRQGLELLSRLPQGDERDRQELSFLIALGPALMATMGWEADDVARTYARARELARASGQPRILFPAVWGLWLVAHASGAAAQARILLRELFDLAAADGDPTLLLQAHHAGGSTMCSDGMLHEAQRHIDAGIGLYSHEEHAGQALRYGGHDPCVCAHSLGALNQLMLGHLETAEQLSQGAMDLAGKLDHRPSVAHAHYYRAELCQIRGDAREAERRARTVLEIAEAYGLPHYVAWATMMIGWAMVVDGRRPEGLQVMERGLARLRQLGIRYHLPHRLAIWAETLAVAGDLEGALKAIDESLKAVEETGERWYEAEVLRLKAEFLARRGGPTGADCEALLERAVAVAGELGAQFWRLRAAKRLSGLWRAHGRAQEARHLLAPIYEWFTEDLDAQDLREAKALLDELH